MIVIACVDDSMGMLFNNRRVSQDAGQREWMKEYVNDAVIWVSPYSAKLFSPEEWNLNISCGFLEKAKKGEYCFVEDADIKQYRHKIEKIILYRWNRSYPSDKKMDLIPENEGFKLKNTAEFAGTSHEKITEEVWER